MQDLDYENELNLLYVIVTVPEGESAKALLCMINEKKGTIDKIVPLPTWDAVGCFTMQFLIIISFFYAVCREQCLF